MKERLGRFVAFGLPIVALAAGAFIPNVAQSQSSPDAKDAVQLREMIKAMGYETKPLNEDAGKEKFEFSIEKGDLNIPVAFEISPSKRYVWFTVYLGDVSKIQDMASRGVKLLRTNGNIQPSQFYVTKSDRLMMALALENRGLDAAAVRRGFEKVADDVSSNKDSWQATD